MNLHDLAKATLTKTFGHINPEGMTKLETKDIIGKELTISDFDFTTDEKGVAYAVVTFKECPNAFYFGGVILTNLCTAIVADADAVVEFGNYGLKVLLSEEKTKDGKKSLVKVKLI